MSDIRSVHGSRGFRKLITSLIVFAWCLGVASTAPAVRAQTDHPIKTSEVGAGHLLLRGDQTGPYVPAPTISTTVEIDVTGVIARATVTQHFENPGDQWVEGVYVFPLPETAAVDRLRLRIGDRFIEGKIEEREAARRAYEQAKSGGQKASLVEQERANIFTNSVANIGPGETVAVRIEYQQAVRVDNGRFSLRFPMTIGARYNPLPGPVADASGIVVTDPVPDRHRISPPVLHPDRGGINQLSMTVRLRAGFALGDLASPHHAIERTDDETGRTVVTLRDGAVAANRDFELVWMPATGAMPQAALFRERLGDDDYLLLMITPPDVAADGAGGAPSPRDMTFVMDVSGSMAGSSIREAKASLSMALDRLRPSDRFNIIVFNNDTWALFPGLQPMSPDNLDAARRFVAKLDANGGTEMRHALERALRGNRDEQAARFHQIVFITDGAVGNEEELFRLIARHLGMARLFTVGIGSAPNAHFMRRAARLGRGSFTYVGSPGQVGQRMAALFAKLEHPMLTDIAADWPAGADVQVWPDPLPDLYAGEPVVMTARGRDLDGALQVTGQSRDETWQVSMALSDAEVGRGVAALWARNKITALEEERDRGGDATAIRSAILSLGMEFSLVTEFTSLVAIDVTPSRPGDRSVVRRDVPVMFPDGWEWAKVFGETPQSMRRASAPASVPPRVASVQTRMVDMPQTATPGPRHVVTGLVLLLFSLMLLAYLRLGRWRPAPGRWGGA